MAASNEQTQSIEKVYARSLLELAESSAQVEQIREELSELTRLLDAEPGLRDLLGSRMVSAAERHTSLERLFKGNISDLLYRFLQVVNDKGRLNLLAPIALAYGKLVDEQQGLVDVDVYVATRLNDAESRRVTEGLSKALNRRVTMHQSVDETLIGGMKIRVGDKLIDASVATQLRRMREQIVAKGREQARGALDQYLTVP